MAAHIPKNLSERLDIIEVIGSRIKLKKAGKNHVACCPFHHEKTPSFSVNASKNFYHCFGCGASGNAINFVMEHDRLSFVEAVESLAANLGLPIPYEGKSKQENTKSTKPIYEVLTAAQKAYRRALKDHPSKGGAIAYLKQRGLNAQIAQEFGIGFAPNERNFISTALGTKYEQGHLQEAGLLGIDEENQRVYDRFRGRLMFPIKDRRGRIIGFGGRILGDGKPKYLNSPETVVFHKSNELYGFYEMRQVRQDLRQIMVVEGYLDVISLAQFGVRNVVATLGTAISAAQIKILLRQCPNILLCFDGDNAGRKAAWKAVEIAVSELDDGQQIKLILLPEGSDPDSLIRELGQEKFNAYLASKAINLSDYLFDYLSTDLDLNALEGKAHLQQKAAAIITQIKGANLRQLLQQKLTQITGLELNLAPNLPPNVPDLSPPNFADEPPIDSYLDNFADNFSNDFDSSFSGDFNDNSANFDNADPFAFEAANLPPSVNNAPIDFAPKNQPKKNKLEKTLQDHATNALRLLLREPAIIKQAAQDLEKFKQEQEMFRSILEQEKNSYQIQELTTLEETIKILAAEPNLNAMQLIAKWHNTENGEILQQIAHQGFVLDENIPQLSKANKNIDLITEFKDVIKQICKLQQKELKKIKTLQKLQKIIEL